MFGIILGAWTIKYFGVSRINWIYKKPRPEGKNTADLCNNSAVIRALDKFRPEVLFQYDWAMFGSLKRYSQVIFYIWFVLSVDSMNFFLKYVLWVSAESDLCKARVFIWAMTAIVTSKEFYVYVDDPNCQRVGPFLWLSILTLLIEYSIWFKFAPHCNFTAPFPW